MSDELTHIDFIKSNLVLDKETNPYPVYVLKRPFTTAEWEMVFDLREKGLQTEINLTKIKKLDKISKLHNLNSLDYKEKVIAILKESEE